MRERGKESEGEREETKTKREHRPGLCAQSLGPISVRKKLLREREREGKREGETERKCVSERQRE